MRNQNILRWTGPAGFVLALSLFVAGLSLKEERYWVATVVLAIIAGTVWAVWVTGACFVFYRQRSATTPGNTQSSVDYHTGWTGAHHTNNRYRVYVGNLANAIQLQCHLWTPQNFHGVVTVRTPDGAVRNVRNIEGPATKHTSFPRGLGHGNDGITSAQDEIVRAEQIDALIVDITDVVTRVGLYVVEIRYTGGSDGTWIQKVEVETSP